MLGITDKIEDERNDDNGTRIVKKKDIGERVVT